MSEQIFEYAGLLEVRRVAGAGHELPSSTADASGDLASALRAGPIQLASDDERSGVDALQPIVQWFHGALPSASQGGRQAPGIVTQALRSEPGSCGLGQVGTAGEERLCFPGIDEGVEAVGLEHRGASLIGTPASLPSIGIDDAR